MNQPSQTRKEQRLPKASISVLRWFDSEAGVAGISGDGASGVDWLRVLPFALLHLSCLLVLVVGWSWTAVGVALALSLYVLGHVLAVTRPDLNTNGLQMVVWGFLISTVALFHGTFTINSLDHMIGTRRHNTPDTSRNNAVLALITLGEGWHNNHHHYAVPARQGFFGREIYHLLLRVLAFLGLVWDLRPVPDHIRRPRHSLREG